MAAREGLQHIFDNPLPVAVSPTHLRSLSWNQNNVTSINPIENSSFTEIFEELHFKENSERSPLSSSSAPYQTIDMARSKYSFSNMYEGRLVDSSSSDYFSEKQCASFHRKSDSFSSMNSESLQFCTEGLGFESSDDVEDLKSRDWDNREEREREEVNIPRGLPQGKVGKEFRRSRSCGKAFPPPISCIGRSGKPGVWFTSVRSDGRFVLKEIRILNQDFLHASREHGSLKLQLVQSEDEDEDEDDDEERKDDGAAEGEDEEEEDSDGDDNISGEAEGNDGEENVDSRKNGVGGKP